ncbi:hypothetical protein RB195_000046 [Necator americanus]|uniref:Uncharacterized protein n=1 Tax=Necator americanus TaxID=51031 RepID=A0ABR1D9G2_NECAM
MAFNISTLLASGSEQSQAVHSIEMNTEEGSSTDEKEIVDVLTHHAGEHEWMQPGRTDVETEWRWCFCLPPAPPPPPLFVVVDATAAFTEATPTFEDCIFKIEGGQASFHNLSHRLPIMQTAVAYLLALILFIHSSLGWTIERNAQDEDEQPTDTRMNVLRQIGAYRLWKRAHNIEPRALSQFKNCYFSPIQCVLMERRRR